MRRSIREAVGIVIAKQNWPEHLIERVGLTHKTKIRRMGAVYRRQIITVVGQKPVPGQVVEVLDALRLEARVRAEQLSVVLLVSLSARWDEEGIGLGSVFDQKYRCLGTRPPESLNKWSHTFAYHLPIHIR